VQAIVVTLFERHDLALVVLAAFVCALSAFSGITLLKHARRSAGLRRALWVAVAAISVGFGIWTTHFVAMLAFSPGISTGYDLPVTLFSLALAIIIVGAGLWLAASGDRRSDLLLGGAVVGVGISVMHYVGMGALLVGGEIGWSGPLVALSIILGMALAAASLVVGAERSGLVPKLAAAGLLTLAICAMHFTGMGAADLSNCFAIVAPAEATPGWLSLVLAGSSILILLAVMGAIAINLRERRRTLAEADRMRELADAAVEGLIVHRNGVIVSANRSFLTLVDMHGPRPAEMPIARFFGPQALAALAASPDQPIETEISLADGRIVPVECILRPLAFAGQPHEAIAVRDLSSRHQAEQHIRYLAHHDTLTGLPNRASFYRLLNDEIGHARRHDQMFAVLCLDLDRFKQVNDLFGHAAGDDLLRRIGDILSRTLGDVGTPARLGGDEFAILLGNVGTPERAGRIAESVLEAIARANGDTASLAMITVSIGIAISGRGGDGEPVMAEKIMNEADTSLYRAKQDGRGVYRFYRAEMGALVRERRLLEHDLRHALALGQFHLVYQPQVDVQTGEVAGFEALLRWDHPERGSVSPAMFVPVAEESGMILAIGEWVLREACEEAQRWTAPLSIAVNVSAVQLHAPGFEQLVAGILAETGLSPDRLEIEITETALVRDVTLAVTVLNRVRAMGVRIAMDDFGTGYSSLANLRAFPFSKIKVDQSFIRSVDTNPQSAAIVRAVLGLGSGLDVPVVAEGVERVEELEFLRGEICQSAQGYLLSRPSRIETFAGVTSGRVTRLGPMVVGPMLRVV
jgi:diguanylate cyclase (GGDEF)-like protein